MLVLAAAAVVAVGLADRDPSRRGADTAGPPVAIARVDVFDPPPGDGHERERGWRGARRRPRVGVDERGVPHRSTRGLKAGVGLVVQLAATSTVHGITVDSPTEGWQAEVYAGDGQATTLAGWGQPVGRTDTVDGSTTISLGDTSASALLVWFTRLGPDGTRFSISVANSGELAPTLRPSTTTGRSLPPHRPAISGHSTTCCGASTTGSSPCAGGWPATRPTRSTPPRRPCSPSCGA